MTTWTEIRKTLGLTKEEELLIKMERDLIMAVSEIREEQGVTQSDLAELCNLKQSAVARLENMKHSPRVDSLIRILAPLGYTLKIVPISDVLE